MTEPAPEVTEPLRVRLDFGYDGTGFHGWAAQPGLRSVEGELSAGLARVLRLETVRLTVAGRTDAGVHATGAVAHLDVPSDAWGRLPGRSGRTPEQALSVRLAGVLPTDIVVRRARLVPTVFNARFSALWRRYEYRLCDRPELLDPRRRGDTVVVRHPIDVPLAHRGAQTLLGLHDFAAFCKPREGATTVRSLLEYSWRRPAEGLVVATVVADAFCHSMVRALIGGILPVASGARPPDWPKQVLAGARRDSRVTVMPAHGLCLVAVGYPPDADLLERNRVSRTRRDAQPIDCGRHLTPGEPRNL